MRRRAGHALALAALLGASLACGRETPPAASKPQPTAVAPKKAPSGPDEPLERANLLNFAHGATVVARTGESSPITSALAAVDGDLAFGWVGPPGDYPQSLTVALPALSRIERVGIATVRPPFAARSLQFETSTDGVTFRPLVTMKTEKSNDPQLVTVPPTDATTVRITIVEGDREGRINALFALGRELAPPATGSIGGCWSVNGMSAQFGQRGAHAFGEIEVNKVPLLLEGGSDGRFFRFTWTRGSGFGFAAISVPPDGRHLSGYQWHEEVIPLFFADSWFGERRDCKPNVEDRGAVLQALLRHTGRAPLYGLRFDANGNLIESESVDVLTALRVFILRNPALQMRLVAHEFRQPTPEKNLAVSNAELASIERSLARNGIAAGRIGFIAAGSDAPREVPVTDAMRALYSSVDLEIRR